MRAAILLAALLPAAAHAQAHAGHGAPSATAPYAGLDAREVARFSPQQVADLLAGRGMGYALSAELNGHPGPAHLLELRDDLGLDEAQVAALTELRGRMAARAQALGAELLAAEGAIDAGFEAGDADRGTLARRVAEAARIEGELRAVHLAAHLETLPLLTAAQAARYQHLRGYDGGTHGGTE